jgi:membrane protease YdiL (CAAX protease family)
MEKKSQKAMWRYVVVAYLLFWIVILVFGGIASMLFQAPPAVMNAITILGSWTPTIALLLMLRKLSPGLTIRGFYHKAFHTKLRITLLVVIPVIIFGVTALSVYLVSLASDIPFNSYISIPSTIAATLLLTVFQGPSGEESGWRGYLRPGFEGRYGFIKGNIILGLVWAFWHAPLWFVASDFKGPQVLIYIVANIVVLTSLTMIMGVFMRFCNNLIIAFWVHFCFNLSLRFISDDIYFFVALSAVYAVVALLTVGYMPKKIKQNRCLAPK